MRRPALAATIAVIAAFTAGAPNLVAAPRICPPGGASGMTFSGGLRVTDGNYCLLDEVTVSGAVVVEAGGVLDLEDSTVNGGVRVLRRGEIEIGISLFGGVVSTSKVNGRLWLDHPVDWDIEMAHLNGRVTINGLGGPIGFAEPTFCGNHVRGGMRVSNVLVAPPGETFFGDPEEEEGLPITCFGNTIHGSFTLRNSGINVEVEGDRVSGSVFLIASTLDLNGNTIGGSLICRSGAVLLPPEEPDPIGNTVRGRNTCG